MSQFGGMIMGGANLLGGIGMSIASGAHGRKAREELNNQNALINQLESKTDSLFNKQYYSDITKRTDIQNMFRLLQENQNKADERAASQAAVLGMTPEQQLAAQEVNRKSYADAIADIASSASQLKDTYMSNYMSQVNNIFGHRKDLSNAIANSWLNQSNQESQAANNMFASAANAFLS